jgi:integrase
MARRPKGDGSYRLRPDGRWEARLTVEENGRRYRRSYFGETQAEARKKMRDAQQRLDQNLPLPPENLTVKTYLESWIAAKKSTLRPRTYTTYEGKVRLHLIPELGKVKLAKLQPAHLLDAYASISGKVSGTTAQHVHGILHVALRDAERQGLVGRNVASLVTAPRRSTGEQKYLGLDEATDLLAAAQGSPLESFFITALLTGLRLGELQALRWRDVDLERRRLVVNRTFQALRDGEPVFGEPKTRNSRRTVWLSDRVVDALERQQSTQEAQERKAGPAWRDYGLVFTSRVGTPLDTYHVSQRHFAKLLETAGLPHMRFHDLRHSGATILLSQGVPVKVVSEMLGHADVTTTLRIYAHVIEGSQAQAVSVLDQLFHA